MTRRRNSRIAILYPGDDAARQAATAHNNRFAQLFDALAELHVDAEPAVYHPTFWQEVYDQLLQVDGVLVWMNPIQDGHDRMILDSMLRDLAMTGIFVSAHPDIILKMGTKEVLYRTRSMGWGSDTHLYRSMEELQQELPARLAAGGARVLKRSRGQSGSGVWKVEWVDPSRVDPGDESRPQKGSLVRVRQAERGSVEKEVSLAQFFNLCKPYFTGFGKMIDQAYPSRLPEGMIRCYLVQDRVAGFGHQAINALYPASPGMSPKEAPPPGPRLYHPPTLPEFQSLKHTLESDWVPEMQQVLGIKKAGLRRCDGVSERWPACSWFRMNKWMHKSWELRAATTLARLWQSQGKRQDAHDLLEPVYGLIILPDSIDLTHDPQSAI